MTNTGYFAAEIRRTVDFKDAVQRYGVALNAKGFSHCPFHGERTASFRAYSDHGYCFGCGWHGDLIAFVRQMFGLDFLGALDKINDDFSLGYPLKTVSVAEQYVIHKRAKALQAQRDKREREQAERERVYQAIMDRLVKADKDKQALQPKNGEQPSRGFVDACKRFERYSDMLDEMTAILWRQHNEEQRLREVRNNKENISALHDPQV